MHRIPLKIVTRLSVIFTVIGLLLVIIGICTGTMIGLIILGAGLVELVGTIIFIAVFRRCPHCGSFLKTGCNRYCPHCGNSWTKLVHDLMKDALCTKAKNLKME